MTIPKLTPYTGQVANPDGSQAQSEFTTNMFNQLSYEADLATELDATIDGINNAVDEVNQNTAIAESSAVAAEAAASSAGYQGLWPDTGGSALKGETYQTQVGGTPTGEYYTALQNTSVDPVGDDVNWKVGVSGSYVNQAQEELIDGSIFPAVGIVENGDVVELGTTHLRVLVGGEPTIVAMSPIANGVISSLTEAGATVGSTPIVFTSPVISNFKDVKTMLLARTIVGGRYCTGGTIWERKTKSEPSVIEDFEPLSEVNVMDFGADIDGGFFDALESAIIASKGVQVIIPYGVYNAGSSPKLIEADRINIRFEYAKVDFFGLTTNDTSSLLWGGVALDFLATEYLNVEGDVLFDFNNTYVYRGVRFREREIDKIEGVSAVNIRPPVGWKEASPPLLSGAIVIGAPTKSKVSRIGAENVYRYYQDGTEITVTSSPSTPLSRCVDVQGTFSESEFEGFMFKDCMMGLLLDSGADLSVSFVNVENALANAVYDLNCENVTYKEGVIKNCKDQGYTLSGVSKRIINVTFLDVAGRPVALHGGDVDGLSVRGCRLESSDSGVQSTFVSIRADAVANTRKNVNIIGNTIDVATCGTLFNLGEVVGNNNIMGNNITIHLFPGNDPNNGAIIDAATGLVSFESNNINYTGSHKFVRAYKGSAAYRTGHNPSNVALANILADNVSGPMFSAPQKSLLGEDATVVSLGTLNMQLPDTVGAKGIGGNYVTYSADVNTFSPYQPAMMGIHGFRWENGNNGDYNTVFEIAKPSDAVKSLEAVLRIDGDGNLHLKSGTSIIYDL